MTIQQVRTGLKIQITDSLILEKNTVLAKINRKVLWKLNSEDLWDSYGDDWSKGNFTQYNGGKICWQRVHFFLFYGHINP